MRQPGCSPHPGRRCLCRQGQGEGWVAGAPHPAPASPEPAVFAFGGPSTGCARPLPDDSGVMSGQVLPGGRQGVQPAAWQGRGRARFPKRELGHGWPCISDVYNASRPHQFRTLCLHSESLFSAPLCCQGAVYLRNQHSDRIAHPLTREQNVLGLDNYSVFMSSRFLKSYCSQGQAGTTGRPELRLSSRGFTQ